MLKQSPFVDELALQDNVSICGFGLELNHIDTKCKVTTHSSKDSLKDALTVSIYQNINIYEIN